jgi:hypothetical protein
MAVRLSALCAGLSLHAGRFLVLIPVRGCVNHRTTVWLEGLGELKNLMTSSAIRLATFQLVALVPPFSFKVDVYTVITSQINCVACFIFCR